MSFKFERLEVWKMAISLSTDIHYLTRDWPKEEMFTLTSQIKRASDSIALNIAEGSAGSSNPEFARFLVIANRSTLEVVSCFYLAIHRDLITQSEFDEFYPRLLLQSKKLQALRKRIKNI